MESSGYGNMEKMLNAGSNRRRRWTKVSSADDPDAAVCEDSRRREEGRRCFHRK